MFDRYDILYIPGLLLSVFLLFGSLLVLFNSMANAGIVNIFLRFVVVAFWAGISIYLYRKIRAAE